MATAALSTPESTVRPAWEQLFTFLREELKPVPGRMRAALIRVAGVLLAMWLGFGLNLPEMSAVVALAFFAASADRDESKKVALGVPVVVMVILLVFTLALNVFGTTPLVRTLAFIIIVFTSLFLLQAAQQGQVFLLAGVFGKVFLQLWDAGYPASLTQELELWVVADLAVAGLCALVVSTLFGKPGQDPVNKFREGLASQFELVAGIVAAPVQAANNRDKDKRLAEAVCSQDQLMTWLDAAAKKNATFASHRTLFVNLVRMSQLLLAECVVLQVESGNGWQQSSEAGQWAGSRCRAIANMVRNGDLLAVSAGPPQVYDEAHERRLVNMVLLAEQVAAGRATLPSATGEKKGFFRPDAFTNPLYLTNAIGAFAAAFACYCLISGTMWTSIGTAVTTCLVTSLTTVEQSRQKQSLRIAGATIGGILTLSVMVYVFPTGSGLVGLSLATALVVFLGGWVFAGSPNLNYAGVQLALCYFLGVFGENKTPTSLTTIRDRIIGIFIGNLAMWLFFDRIRPAWTVDSSRCAFADEVEAIARLVAAQRSQQDPQRVMQLIARECETFTKARAALKAMSDTTSPAFSPWAKAQQKDAPMIRYAESQLNYLFSLEFVQAASALLRLSEPQPPEENRDLKQSLLVLASRLRSGKPIESSGSEAQQLPSASVGAPLRRVQKALATVFSQS